MEKALLFFIVHIVFTFTSQAQTVVDYDGNVYDTVHIGSQVWLKQNLKVTHFANGVPIPNRTTAWEDTAAAYCDYNNNPNNSISYGRLYNWYAVSNVNNLCPNGWHVPSNGEWNIMVKYLDISTDTTIGGWVGTTIGDQLKESGTIHWASGNNGTNSSGFTALPGGFREIDDSFNSIGYTSYWWTTSVYAPWYALNRALFYDFATISWGASPKPSGFSVRCIKNVTTQINDNDFDNHIQIYPNPASERVFINCADRNDFKMEVLNIVGECVLRSHLKRGINSIDISPFSPGVYVIRLIGANETCLKKMIKN